MTATIAIGVDIGTTSTKAVAYDLDGRVVAHHAIDYPLLRPTPDAAEQDPDAICAAVLETIRVAVAGARGREAGCEIACVAFSAAMHSLIAVDAVGRPTTRSITWADNRAATAAARIKAAPGAEALYRRTGTPIHPMSPLAKLAWLHAERPEIATAAARFVGIKELVFFRLFGEWVVDLSIASATGLLNLERLDWDDEALAVAGIGRERLSTLVPTTHRLHGLPPSIATRLGLDAATPFVVGANDGVLSNLGVDAIRLGEVAVTIGTSGAMRTVVDRPATDAEGRTFCYLLDARHWVVGGPVNNGGIVLRWVRDEFAAAETETAKRLGIDPYEVLTRIAERIAPGAEGLLFHPFLAGERAPYWSADMRGSFFGLGLHHRKEHMIRAVLEGVIFALHGILPAVEALVGTTTRLKATGGFARSPLWRQMMADIFDREVIVPESFESSCLGAAVLGWVALGRLGSLEEVGARVGTTHRHLPIAANVAVYRRLRPIFDALPVQLAAQYRQIASFQREDAAARAAAGPTRRDAAP